jgi:hypothetical protein
MATANVAGATLQTTLIERGILMTATEPRTEQEEMWSTFFDDNHADLVIVAEMLLRCDLSPERILRKALSGLESSPCEVTFGQAIHAVIDTVIEYNRETANSPLQAKTLPSVKLRVPGMSQIAMLPWPERAVYFLRGILHYSCEEIGLLLRLSDVQIDQLYKFAAKRIDYESKTNVASSSVGLLWPGEENFLRDKS